MFFLKEKKAQEHETKPSESESDESAESDLGNSYISTIRTNVYVGFCDN